MLLALHNFIFELEVLPKMALHNFIFELEVLPKIGEAWDRIDSFGIS